MLRYCSLGSGSSGNAAVVEAGDGVRRTRLLVDCGLGPRQLTQRLAAHGLLPEDLDAVFITHEHSDHVGCVVALSGRHALPVWMGEGTWRALGTPDLGDRLHFASDRLRIEVGALQILPFRVPHDAAEPLQLRCGDGRASIGIATDLGHVDAHVAEHLAGCQALILECNHDEKLLAASSYPPFLKRRVAGPRGHLSNAQATELARVVVHAGLRHVVAAHLSERNNRPELARAALAEGLGCSPGDVVAAHAEQGVPWLEV